MKVYELVQKHTWNECFPILRSNFQNSEEFNDAQKNAEYEAGMQKALALLKQMQPRERPAGEEGPNTVIVKGDLCAKSYDSAQADPDNYGIGSQAWRDLLAMKISDQSLAKYPGPKILVELLWEMTWFGFDEETIQKEIKETFK